MKTSRKGMTPGLRNSASMVILAAAAAAAFVPSTALAQDAPAQDPSEDATQVDEVIVTGTRRALETSQELRRNADTVVDTITATDIGAFPDKSVAEALQRVPGVTVNRFAASDDTSHFGAEPSGVLVRGLQQVRSEYNGRDTFSANSSRGLSWGDISPELMQGVDTYKNQTAELIEGGIAGTINLRTRVPFDSPGRLMQLSANVNYGDISKEYTPEASAIFSDRWVTDMGEFGFLANIAYSDVTTNSQTIQYGRMGIFEGVFGPGTQYIPSSVGYRDTEYQRQRNGLAFAAQWESTDGKLMATAQYNRSDFTNQWRERGVIGYNADMFALPTDFSYSPGGPRAQWIPVPAQGTPGFTFDSDGNFQNGTLVIQQTDTFWWGASDAEATQIAVNDQGQNMLVPCYAWQGTCTNPTRGGDINAVTRYNETNNLTEDAAVNLRWAISDRLRANFDAQFIHSEVDNYDIEVGQYSFGNMTLDASGDRPVMTFSAPTNIRQSAGGLSNANNYRYNHAMDHLEDSEGDEVALRADLEYDIDTNWLNSLRVGVRYADREQAVKYSGYNWGNITNNWNLGSGQAAYWNIDRTAPNGAFNGYPTGLYETRELGGGFFGGGANPYVFFDMDRLAAHGADLLSYDNIGVGQDQWRPICDRPGEVDGCFRANELNDVEEETQAAYAMLRFGGDNALLGGTPVSGNIGFRYVETENTSTGSLSYPVPFSPGTLACNPVPPIPGVPSTPGSIGCYLSADDIAFNSGGGLLSTAESKHRNWLPSFNIKFDIREDWVLRFAASRAMARPDIGLLKNYIEISTSLPGTDPTDPRYVTGGGGVITGVNPTYTANAYNPYLEPTTADQFDLALEHYFAEVGSLTFTAFYKTFDNYIQYGSYDLDVTNNGVTRTVRVRGPMNGDGAKIRGIEVAYQRFFDFLPGPWAGLGMQANYTYIDNQGITNTNLKVASGGADGQTAQPGSAGTVLTVDKLEGLSDHQYNLVGMYEWGPWAARLAYNWRSDYLVTAVDCCVYLPIWQEAAGFLDGSIRYAVNDRLELSLQGSNLLNTETRLFQQVNNASEGGTLTPNAWLQSDRRLVFGFRFRY
ncbi:TonB-dependent receptor [Brevundimonas alba]|uniref:TonB-dependent receptor n=1 Tax=Brevundimonas alba TaxID=74314 RepID=A0A7X6BP74_9CAUL|nr:TonB-dependent receptor [Brevundimonas alba]NJC41226.1 TonB-dependent receptor [Brevundimonas alba]